jgi:hypothetical protein
MADALIARDAGRASGNGPMETHNGREHASALVVFDEGQGTARFYFFQFQARTDISIVSISAVRIVAHLFFRLL